MLAPGKNSQHHIVVNLLDHLLMPVARFCVRRSVRLQNIAVSLKRCLARAAAEQLKRDGLEVSASRISVMTGVHRKDLRDLLDDEELPLREHAIVRLLTLWQVDQRFITSGGRPGLRAFQMFLKCRKKFYAPSGST